MTMIEQINENWPLNTHWIYSMKLVTTVRYVQLPFFGAAISFHFWNTLVASEVPNKLLEAQRKDLKAGWNT